MNQINYQPTGVYQQFVKNPGLLNQGGAAQTPKNSTVENLSDTQIKTKKALKIGGLLVASAAIIAFAKYYKKGIDIIEQKKELAKELGFVSPAIYFEKKPFGSDEINKMKEIWANGEKFEKNIVGKIKNGLDRIHTFFKDNFYNY